MDKKCDPQPVEGKEKREVGFLVSRDSKPWFMVEVKTWTNEKLSPHLEVFRGQLAPGHVFQVAMDAGTPQSL